MPGLFWSAALQAAGRGTPRRGVGRSAKRLEFGSKNAAAISACLPASRACAYRSIALRAERGHSSQACLAFLNPPLAETRFDPYLPSLTRVSNVPCPDFQHSMQGCVKNGSTESRPPGETARGDARPPEARPLHTSKFPVSNIPPFHPLFPFVVNFLCAENVRNGRRRAPELLTLRTALGSIARNFSGSAAKTNAASRLTYAAGDSN